MNFNDYFIYCENSHTGLRWKQFNNSNNPNHKRFKGDVAGHLKYSKEGNPLYGVIRLKGKNYKSHRIVWILNFGNIDENKVIDHIDGNPFNNSINNLRLVDQSVNCKNCKISKSNKTGRNHLSFGTKVRKNKVDYYLVIAYYQYNPYKYVRHHFNMNDFDSKELAIEFGNLFLSYVDENLRTNHGYSERHGQ